MEDVNNNQRERAERWLDLAEKKYTRDCNVDRARSMALEAQSLYPALPGISQKIAAYDVIIASIMKFPNGDSDWHGILGIDAASATTEIVQQQLNKMREMFTRPGEKRSPPGDNSLDDALMFAEHAAFVLSTRLTTGDAEACLPTPMQATPVYTGWSYPILIRSPSANSSPEESLVPRRHTCLGAPLPAQLHRSASL